MIGEHPIGGAAAVPIVFDALTDAGTIRATVEAAGIEMICLAQLDAQRHITGIRRTDIPAHRKHITTLDHLAHRQSENAVEIGMPVLIAARGPAFSERIDLSVQGRITGRGARPDAGADDVVDQHLHRLRGHRVVAHQIPHAMAQQRAIGGDLSASAAVAPVFQPAVPRPRPAES